MVADLEGCDKVPDDTSESDDPAEPSDAVSSPATRHTEISMVETNIHEVRARKKLGIVPHLSLICFMTW